MANSIKKNFFYNASYQVLTLILPLITTPYISRVMGAEKVGIYSYAYSIAYYFGLFILLGLNNYGNRTIAGVREDKEKLSKTFWSIYAMQLLLGIIIVAIYLLYCAFIAQNQLMALIQLIYLISVMLDINWFFFGLEQFKLTVTRNTIIKILTVTSILCFVKNVDDLYIYAMIMVTGPLISQLYLWLFLRKYISFSRISWNDIIKHIVPNLTLFIPVIAISLYTTMAKILLGAMTNMTEVGYFESANKLTVIPSMAITSLGTVMLPRISNMVSHGQHQETMKYLQKSLIVSVFLSVSMALGLSAISKEFVPFFYGEGFKKCEVLIPILILSSIFISWANVIRTQYLIPYKKDKIYIVSVFLGAIFNIFINIILIPMFQSVGAALGSLCAEITVCCYQTFKVRKEMKIKLYLKQSVPFLIFGIIMYIAVICIPLIHSYLITIVIKVLVGSIIYLLLSGIYYKYILKQIF